jgi:hypothetical protein
MGIDRDRSSGWMGIDRDPSSGWTVYVKPSHRREPPMQRSATLEVPEHEFDDEDWDTEEDDLDPDEKEVDVEEDDLEVEDDEEH